MDDAAEGLPILDVRSSLDFERLHIASAVNIPLEELVRRVHELPPRSEPFIVYDAHPVRARWAASRLRARGRAVAKINWGADQMAGVPTAVGPSQGRLWRPHALLEEALRLARRNWSSFEGRRALDLACGAGRDAVFLALAGFEVEARDILPDALDLCTGLATRCRASVLVRCQDLEDQVTLPREQYDVVCVFNYLHRPLMEEIGRAVRPGGLIVYETFLETQRTLFGKPRRDEHLLRAEELPGSFAGWEVLVHREGLAAPRRYAASLIARKPE